MGIDQLTIVEIDAWWGMPLQGVGQQWGKSIMDGAGFVPAHNSVKSILRNKKPTNIAKEFTDCSLLHFPSLLFWAGDCAQDCLEKNMKLHRIVLHWKLKSKMAIEMV